MNRNTGALNPVFGPFGFELSSKINLSEISCINFESIYFQIQLAILKKKNGLEPISSSFENCKTYLNKHLLSFQGLTKAELENEERLARHLEKYFDRRKDKEEIDRILEIYRVKNNYTLELDQNLFSNVIELMKRPKEDLEENFFLCKSILVKNKIIGATIMGSIVEIIVSLKCGNPYGAQRILSEMIKKDRRGYIFEGQNKSIRRELIKEQYQDFLPMAFKYIKDALGNHQLFRMFYSFWTEIFQGEEIERIKRLDANASASWSLYEVRQLLNSPSEGPNYFSLWFPFILKRAPFNDSQEQLRIIFQERPLEVDLSSMLWMYPYYWGQGEKVHPAVLEAVLKLKASVSKEKEQSPNWYQQFLLIELAENEQIKSFLSKMDEGFRRPLNQIKREYFRKLLNSGQSTDFAIYQLLSLGDMEQEFIWWMYL